MDCKKEIICRRLAIAALLATAMQANIHAAEDLQSLLNTNPNDMTKEQAAIEIKKRTGIDVGLPADKTPNPPLAVFISMSMPKNTLKLLARQTAKYGGVLVLRGFRYGLTNQNLIKSSQEIRFMQEEGATVQIDPQRFANFGISRVPVFVLTPNGRNSCSTNVCSISGKVVGDVSLDYALERLANESGEVGRIAKDLLAKNNK